MPTIFPAPIPVQSELLREQILMRVKAYDQESDAYEVETCAVAPNHLWLTSTVTAVLMPALTKKYDEPGELIGRTFIISLP